MLIRGNGAGASTGSFVRARGKRGLVLRGVLLGSSALIGFGLTANAAVAQACDLGPVECGGGGGGGSPAPSPAPTPAAFGGGSVTTTSGVITGGSDNEGVLVEQDGPGGVTVTGVTITNTGNTPTVDGLRVVGAGGFGVGIDIATTSTITSQNGDGVRLQGGNGENIGFSVAAGQTLNVTGINGLHLTSMGGFFPSVAGSIVATARTPNTGAGVLIAIAGGFGGTLGNVTATNFATGIDLSGNGVGSDIEGGSITGANTGINVASTANIILNSKATISATNGIYASATNGVAVTTSGAGTINTRFSAIGAGITAFSSSGAGNVTVNSGQAIGNTLAGYYGIDAQTKNTSTGAISVTSTASIHGTDRGISAVSVGRAITVDASGAILSGNNGIFTAGANGTTITTSGGGTINSEVAGTGTGINISGTGAAQITQGAAIGTTTAFLRGIDVTATGSGTVTVNSNAAITGTGFSSRAINVTTAGGAATVTTNSAINSGGGIFVNTGTGVSTVTVGGAITLAGNSGSGVEAYLVNAASVINVNANITGGNRAISGKGTINVATGVAVTTDVFAVDLSSTGTLNNRGTLTANYRTVGISGTLNNFAGATITSTGTYATAQNRAAVYVQSSGTVTNNGTITGTAADGVYSLAFATVTNTGSISGVRGVFHDSANSMTLNNTGGTINGSVDAVNIQGGGRLILTNTGTIQTVGGTAGAGAGGVYLFSANGTPHSITNSGTINGGSAATFGYGVDIDTGALTLTNQSGGNIGGGLGAIRLSTTGATTLDLQSGSSANGAIFSEDTGARTITLGGALTGNSDGGTGTGVVAFTLGATGAMQGATFGSGNDTFTFQGGTIAGTIAAGTGTDALVSILGAGTGTLNQSNLSGFDSYEARSGTLTLTGTGNLGWSITGGRLIVNGSILSAQGAIGAASGTQLDVGATGSINTTANGGVAIQGPTGGTFRIDNAGAIGNGISGGNTIQAGQTVLTLNNSGTITTPNFVTVLGGANSIITNIGTITGGANAGGSGMGVQINGVGTVNNNSGGTITTAGNFGVRFEGAGQVNNALGATISYSGNANRTGAAVSMVAGGTVSNLGTIDMPGTSGQGIILDNGGTVNNGSGSNTTALIRSNPGTGVLSTGSAATNVTNYGRITGGNAIAHVDGGSGALIIDNLGAASIIDGVSYSGIVAESGGVTLQNQGVVAGLQAGVTSSGTTTKISNTGTIGTGTVTGGVFTLGGSGFGISAAGGSITNSGTINATQTGIYATGAVTLTNTGTIHSAGSGGTSDGVVFNNSATTVTALNSGTISSDIYSGFWSFGTLSLTNAAAGQLIGGTNVNFGEGIQTTGVSTINNYGTITGSGATTGIVQHGNFATTINLFAGSTTGGILTSSGNDTLALYNGQVNGAAVMQGYTDAVSGSAGSVTLQNTGTLAAAIVGTVNLGGGTDTLQLRGTGTGAQAGSFAISTSTGAEVLTKADAGTWTLTGAAITPAITINAGLGGAPGSGGLLVFNGSTGLTGTINVNGGTIRANTAGAFGTGTINAIDPTIQYNATGTYANNISLASIDTVNDPTRLEVGNGFTATLTGQITQATVGQPLVFGLISGATSGTIVLANPVLNNNWTGVTTIEAGTTLRGTTSQISGGSIVNNGALNYNQTFTGVENKAISGTGSLLVNGAGGTVALFNAATFTGGTTVDTATLQIGDGTTNGSITGSIALANNALLVFSRNDNYVNSSAISGNGRVRLLGTETLNGNITSTGDVFKDAGGGTTTLGGTRSGGNSSGVTVSGTNANLIVASTGAIQGGQYLGVRLSGSGATLTNLGSVTNIGTGGDSTIGAGVGVFATTGANTITNGSVSNATALISGRNAGINHANGSAGTLTVNNYGIVDGDLYNGIENQSGSGALTLNNFAGGTVVGRGNAGGGNGIVNSTGNLLTVGNAGRIVGRTNGIDSLGAVTITNSGTIAAGTLSGGTTGTLTLSGGAAIRVNGGGTITNQAGGQINGAGNAGIYSTTALTVGNAGNISTIGTGGNDAITILGAATITNTGTITAPDASGIAFTAAGSVTNSGTITGGAGAPYGYAIAGGGTINNQAGGVLTGGAGGLNLSVAGANTVTNTGRITGTNANSVGINAGVGTLSLTNNAAGIIAGRTNGVVSSNAGASVTNAGTIGVGTVSGGVFTQSGSGYGLSLQGGTVANLAGGAIRGGFSGVYSAGASNTVTSAGIISGSGIGIWFSNAAATSSVTNQTGGVISGDRGVDLSGQITLINSGQITGGASGAGVITRQGSATVTNNLGGTISGGLESVDFFGTGGSLTNNGTLSSDGTAVLFNGSGTGTVANTGTITGGSIGIAAYFQAANITNTGSISGTSAAITLNGTFDDVVNLNGGSVTGAVTLGDGDDTLNFRGGTFGTIDGGNGTNLFNVALGAGNSNSINLGNVSNFAYYGLDSGNLTITGSQSGASGFNLANDTTLNVDGSFAGLATGVVSRDTSATATVNVLAGGALGATGDAIFLSSNGANSVNNAGTITSDTGFAVNLGGGTLINNGTINGGTAGAVQLASDNAGTIDLQVNSITNGDVLSSGLGDRTLTIAGMLNGAYLSSGSGVDSVTLSSTGTITSADLGDGDDVFKYFGGNITGIVNGGIGTDSLFGDFGAGNAYNVTLSNFINFENFAFASGDATITGPSQNPDATIYAGNGTPSGQVTFVDTQDNTGDIYVNGGTIRAQTAGAFGSGAIHMVDPTIFYGATGIYANDILLEVTTPASNNPSTLSADFEIVATLTGAITQGSGTNINGDPIDSTQPLTIAGQGMIILTNTANNWLGTTTIDSGATLQGETGTISGSDITLNGTLVYAQDADGTAAQAITGNGALIKQGTGTAILSGANGYTGGTSVQAGTLVSQNSGNGFGYGTTDIASGATAQYDNQTGGTIYVAGGTITGAGTLLFTTGAGSSTALGNNGGNVSVLMSQGGLIDIQGAGIVNGSCCGQGIWSSNRGSLNIGTGATFDGVEGYIVVDALTGTGVLRGGFFGQGSTTVGIAGGSATFDGTITDSVNFPSPLTLIKEGAGTQTLTGANSYTGQTTINGGTLALSGSGSIATSFVQDDAVFSIAGLTNGGTSILGLSGTGSVLLGANTLMLNGGGASNFSGVAGGTGGITLQNGGTLTLSGANTYTGTTSIENGTLIFGADNVLADTSTLNILNGGTLDLNGHSDTVGTFNLTGTLTGGGTLTAANYNVYGGSTINQGIGGGALNIFGDTALNSETTAAPVNIYAGTLTLGAAERLADTGAVNIAAGGALTLGGAETIGSLSDLGGTGGTVDLAANLLTIGGANTDTSFSGVIGGAGDLTKTGTGTQTLTGANTFAGLTTIDGGTLALGGSQAIADGNTVLVNGGGTLALLAGEQFASLTGTGNVALGANTLVLGVNIASSNFAGVIGGTGGISQFGTGTLTLSGANTYTGTTNVSGGTLVLGASNVLADASTLLLQNATGNIGANSDTITTLFLTDSILAGTTGTLTAQFYALSNGTVSAQTGAGYLYTLQQNTLSTINAASAANFVEVDTGTLALGASNLLSDTSSVTVGRGAAIFDMGANSDTVGSVNVYGTLAGTGTLSANTYSLVGGTVNANLGAGTLTVSHDAFGPAGTTVSTLNGTAAATNVQIDGQATLVLGASNRLADTATVSVNTTGILALGANSDTVEQLNLFGTLNGTGTLTAANYFLNGGTVNANLGTGTLINSGGTSALNGTAGADAVFVSAGSLVLGASNRLADNAAVSVFAGGTLNIGAFNDTVGNISVSGTLAGTGTVTGSVVGANGANYTLNGGTVNANLGTGILRVVQNASTLNGTSAASTVNITSGSLALGASNRLADTATVSVASGAALNLGTFNDTVGLLGLNGTLDGTGTLTAAEYQLNGATVNGNLGAGNLFNVSGSSILNGTSAASLVSVQAGTLALGASNRLADTATLAIASGATLDMGAFNDTIAMAGINGTLNGTGTLTADTIQLNGATVNANVGGNSLVNTGGVSTLNGMSSAATLSVNAGTVRLGGSNRLADNSMAIVSVGSILDIGANTDTVATVGLNGTLAGTGTLTATQVQLGAATVNANLGTGTLINVSGNSVLNGTSAASVVNVQGGTLTLGASERLANTAQLAINTGATFSLLSYTETVGSLTNGAAGGGTLALGTGRLVLAGNGDYGYSGQITGTGSLDHTGTGRLTLMGDFATTGRIDASAGTLAFAGTSLGSARVQGGTLIGAGTFGGSLVMTSGTLSPGGLLGTNNVVQPLGMFRADNLAVSGGNLLFDFGGQNLGNVADVIRVTGPAVLTGGTVNVNALSAANQYAFNNQYTIVQAGTLTGTFANGTTFASVSNDASLKWRLRYDLVPNAVVLQVQKQLDFAAAVAGGSPNQLAIGNALNGSAGMASDQWAATLNAINAVPAAQRGATYNSLSGEAISDVGTSTIVANTLFLDLMRDRIGDGDDTLTGSGFASASLNGVRSVSTQQRGLANALAGQGDGGSGGAVWAQAYGGLQRLSGQPGQATLETTVAGAAMGAEGRIGDLTLGVAGGYTGVTADVNARNSTVDGRLVQAGGYASYDSGSAFVNVAGNYYTGKFDSVRTINVGGALSTALGDLKSHGYAVSASAGYRADLGGGLRMVAVASATQTHDSRDAFTERAPGGLGLTSAAAKRDLFTATGEVRLGQWIKTGSGYAMPYVSAGVRYNAGDLDTVGNMRFSGAPTGLGAFQVQGARISPLVGTWGAGVDVKASDRVTLGIAVESAYAKHTREGRASMRVKIGF